MHQVVLYSKPDCRLCDEARTRLQKLQEKHPFELREVNILEDRDAFEQFKNEIPVGLVNGKKAFKFHLDEKKFLRRLKSSAAL